MRISISCAILASAALAEPASAETLRVDVALAAAPAPVTRPAAAISASDRKAILDVLRAPLEKQLGKPVEFVVSELRGRRGWAFIQAEPQRPGGRKIDVRAYFPRDWEEMDGLTTTAILRKRGGRWRVRAMKIGALDAWYCGYLPAAQFDPCKP
jgi:hypothetical protein